MLKIFHNNRCGKSRQTLEIIRSSGQQVEVVEYLKATPTVADLREIVEKLGIKPSQLIRKGERIFKEKFAGRTLSEEEWLQAMIEHPVLIERPIVIKGDQAVIGRPPELVKTLL
ncbi:arsenate reductase (glutaredoxin) [Pontibacter sp. SGAir0037]|uniref:arsenate reductase (glutaredoxin) n=1 Tax=Pontibacter sp. SGAir0037 TaxID=2571030 RepID=UPI0010CD2F0C|nr:arsenate reductase (glutaredoxin) [Pontibacter sp. SGAir0037]QCR21525.1 arsenate reductase (glutaredoxin) [Pontibacter sp. SGAir0037]